MEPFGLRGTPRVHDRAHPGPLHRFRALDGLRGAPGVPGRGGEAVVGLPRPTPSWRDWRDRAASSRAPRGRSRDRRSPRSRWGSSADPDAGLRAGRGRAPGRDRGRADGDHPALPPAGRRVNWRRERIRAAEKIRGEAVMKRSIPAVLLLLCCAGAAVVLEAAPNGGRGLRRSPAAQRVPS